MDLSVFIIKNALINYCYLKLKGHFSYISPGKSWLGWMDIGWNRSCLCQPRLWVMWPNIVIMWSTARMKTITLAVCIVLGSQRAWKPPQIFVQRSSLIRVYTVCHSVCIVWAPYSMVEPHSSNFRVITTNFLGVQIFRKFTVKGDEKIILQKLLLEKLQLWHFVPLPIISITEFKER